MDLYAALADERCAIADRLDHLTPEQWRVQTLCASWDVHGLVAHLVVPTEFSVVEMLVGLARAGGDPDRLSVQMASRRAELSSSELVARLRTQAASRKAPPIIGIIGPYTDALVHSQDMWLPLGLDDDRPAERWRPSLDFLVSKRATVGFLPRRAPDLWYQATDLEWQHGGGAVVSGPAGALALALLGRTPRLDELDGPGADTLRAFAARS